MLPTHHDGYSLRSWTNSSAIDNDHDGKDDGDDDVVDNDDADNYDADNHADVKTLTMATQTLTLTAMMLRG